MCVICSCCGKTVYIDSHDEDIIKRNSTQYTYYVKINKFLCIDCIKKEYCGTQVEQNRLALGLHCDN